MNKNADYKKAVSPEYRIWLETKYNSDRQSLSARAFRFSKLAGKIFVATFPVEFIAKIIEWTGDLTGAQDLILSFSRSRLFTSSIMVVAFIVALATRPKKSDEEVQALSARSDKENAENRHW